MTRRIAALVAALALVGALFAGVPSAVKASGTDYIAISGVTYTGTHAADCNGTSYKTDGTADNVQVDSALSNLEGSGTIYFCPGTYNFNDYVSDGGDFTITGADAATTIIDGGDVTNLFNFEGGVIDVSYLTLQHAYSANVEGGAIIASDNVTVDHANFNHNVANMGGGAIAIYSESSASVSVTNSTFTDNTALDAGGAIATYGYVTVANSTFTNNTSIADRNCVGGGGAIAAGKDVGVTNSTFTNNRAILGEDTIVSDCFATNEQLGGIGGAIGTAGLEYIANSKFTHNVATIAGGAIAAFGVTSDALGGVESATFAGNDVTSGLAYTGLPFPLGGNAIFNLTYGLSIVGSTFTSNGHRVTDAQNSNGGAVMSVGLCECDGSLNVTNSTFSGNFGLYGGALSGVNMYVYKSAFTGNTAFFTGGAITGNSLIIDGSTFVGNASQRGGAVWYCTDSAITNSTFKRNRATLTSDAASGVGGALGGYPLLTLTNNRFTANRASRAGGAVWFTANAVQNFETMTKNRFVANRARKAGGAIGFNTNTQTVTRSQISKVARKNRFSANNASRGANINGSAVNEGP